MTVTAPPRPPRPSDPMDREEVEALVEALIEEARQRAQRRRRRNAALVIMVALVEIHVVNADGSGERTLARSGGRNRGPSWSPHGRRIACVSKRGGNNEIYVMNADGSGQRNLTRTRRSQERWAAWSPTR